MQECGTKGADEHIIEEEQEGRYSTNDSSKDAPLKIFHGKTLCSSVSMNTVQL
jgi:hypothetical protein